MGDEFWNQLRIQTEAEVKKKTFNYRYLSQDIVDEIVAEVLVNAHEKHVSGSITKQDQLYRHAENHIINAIRKIKRLYYRDWNVLEFIKDDIELHDLELPIETIALEGIPHLSPTDLNIAKQLSMGFTQADILRKKIVSSRRQLRKSINKIKPFLT